MMLDKGMWEFSRMHIFFSEGIRENTVSESNLVSSRKEMVSQELGDEQELIFPR